jgi:antitoxin FitA
MTVLWPALRDASAFVEKGVAEAYHQAHLKVGDEMMNAITIRNLSDAATRALEARAAENGTTAEMEAERILQEALAVVDLGKLDVEAETPRVGLGTALRQLGERFPELADIDFSRDQTPAWSPSSE